MQMHYHVNNYPDKGDQSKTNGSGVFLGDLALAEIVTTDAIHHAAYR